MRSPLVPRRARAARAPALAAAALTALLALPAAASAASSMQVGIADDGKLFTTDTAAVTRLVDGWRAAGVDVVRIYVPWSGIAPDSRSTVPPRAFRADDPSAPGYTWDFLDRAVAAVRGDGMRVSLEIAGPAPWWASGQPSRHDGRWMPSASQYRAFATAVATRYRGQVSSYALWNEPNQPTWLEPQSSAPDVYRAMVQAAEPAIHAADPGAPVLMGELASTGHTAGGRYGGLAPLAFMRRMACVDSRYRVVRTGACRGFRAPVADAFSLHPHGIKLSPYAHSRNPDEATIGDLGRFEGVLDRLTRAHRLRPSSGSRFAIYLDEFGYQTNPPDRYLGVSWNDQARWLERGAQIAWSDPRVRNLSWYVWTDEALGPGGGGWQSGLYTSRGQAKPSRTAFGFPFLASRSSVWGQVRPGGAHTVTVWGRGRTGPWRRLARFGTDGFGGFDRRLREPGWVRSVRATATGAPGSLATGV